MWIWPRCILILPDRDVDLGIIGAEEAMRVDRKVTQEGEIYQAPEFTPVTRTNPNRSPPSIGR